MNVIKIEDQELLTLARAASMANRYYALQNIHATMATPNSPLVWSACQNKMLMIQAVETLLQEIKDKYHISFTDYRVDIVNMELRYA